MKIAQSDAEGAMIQYYDSLVTGTWRPITAIAEFLKPIPSNIITLVIGDAAVQVTGYIESCVTLYGEDR